MFLLCSTKQGCQLLHFHGVIRFELGINHHLKRTHTNHCYRLLCGRDPYICLNNSSHTLLKDLLLVWIDLRHNIFEYRFK